MTTKKTARAKPPTSDTYVDLVGGGQALVKGAAPKRSELVDAAYEAGVRGDKAAYEEALTKLATPKPREQRLVMGNVPDFNNMQWVFARLGQTNALEVFDEYDDLTFTFTVAQANALLEFLQDVVPLMQDAPADPTAPLVRYVP